MESGPTDSRSFARFVDGSFFGLRGLSLLRWGMFVGALCLRIFFPGSNLGRMNEYIKTSAPRACGIAAFPPGAALKVRTLKAYELIWILEGVASISYDGATMEAPEHTVLLLRPDFPHAIHWDPWRPSRHAYIHFEIQELPSEMPPPNEWPLFRAPDEGDILRPQFRYLLNWYGRGRPELTRLTLQHILATFITGESAIEKPGMPAEPTAVQKALAFLHKRMEQDPAIPVHLAQLAKAARVTPEHLCRAFRQVTGRSPAETVRLARLDRSALLLARTAFDIQEIARMCGFASPFHFSRRFSDAFGFSPRAFRKKISAGEAPPEPLLSRVAMPKQKSKALDAESTARALYLDALAPESAPEPQLQSVEAPAL
jgi:AraC family transcriptional regulator